MGAVGNAICDVGSSHAMMKTSCFILQQEQLETKTKDICVIRWSKPSGVYIMNFYRPKYVSCKKTESGERTRCPRGRGRAQGVGRALHPRGGLVSFPDCFLFFYFSKYSKTEKKMPLELFWSRFTYRTTYLFLFGV